MIKCPDSIQDSIISINKTVMLQSPAEEIEKVL